MAVCTLVSLLFPSTQYPRETATEASYPEPLIGVGKINSKKSLFLLAKGLGKLCLLEQKTFLTIHDLFTLKINRKNTLSHCHVSLVGLGNKLPFQSPYSCSAEADGSA